MDLKQKNELVVEYAKRTTDPSDVAYMAELLEAEIQYWIENYSSMGFFKEEDYKISDIMLFAHTKDKVLIFVDALLLDSNDGQVKLISGQLHEDDKWYFRYAGMPNFYYEYNDEARQGKKFTKEEILSLSIDQLIQDGLVNEFNLISQDYLVNKWFPVPK